MLKGVKEILLIFLLLLPLLLSAQKRKVKNNPWFDKKILHLGYTIGMNTMAFKVTPANNFLKNDSVYGLTSTGYSGFNLGGPILNFRIGEYFDFRTMFVLSFGQRDLVYTIKRLKYTEGNPPFYDHAMRIESIYSEFPILLKFKGSRLNNSRPYIIGGINPKIDWATQSKITEEEMPKIRLKPYDLCIEVGFGFDFYLEYFKLSAELKLSMGTNNLVKYDGTQYTTSIQSLKSRMVMFSLHFE
jgi:hypothetical protein